MTTFCNPALLFLYRKCKSSIKTYCRPGMNKHLFFSCTLGHRRFSVTFSSHDLCTEYKLSVKRAMITQRREYYFIEWNSTTLVKTHSLPLKKAWGGCYKGLFPLSSPPPPPPQAVLIVLNQNLNA